MTTYALCQFASTVHPNVTDAVLPTTRSKTKRLDTCPRLLMESKCPATIHLYQILPMHFCKGHALLTFHLYTHAAVWHVIKTINSLSVPVASAPRVQNKRANTASSTVRTFLCHRHAQHTDITLEQPTPLDKKYLESRYQIIKNTAPN